MASSSSHRATEGLLENRRLAFGFHLDVPLRERDAQRFDLRRNGLWRQPKRFQGLGLGAFEQQFEDEDERCSLETQVQFLNQQK